MDGYGCRRIHHSRVGGNLGGEAAASQNNHIPLSLDGRGIKGEGENDATHRHNPENPHNPANPDSERQNTAMPCIIPHPVDTALKPV